MEGYRAPGVLFALLLVQAVNASPVDYPLAGPGASFDAVLELPAAEPAAVYRYGEADTQFVELWLPAGEAPAPVAVFVHGGCWLNQYGIGHTRALATALAQAGYAVWNIEYRRVGDPGGGWPGSLDDIHAALGLLERLELPRLDLSRLVLAGHSAGGHLALLAAAGLQGADLPGARLPGARLPGALHARGVVGLAPITDIASYAAGEGSCNRGAKAFLGDGIDAAQIAAANPASRPAPPGTVILLGSEDRIVPYRVPGLQPHTLVGMTAGHFDWIHPGTPAWGRFLHELERVTE